ncbi:SusD/RagB family nutrient-binding outer membrane lipoprotein [Arcticibacter tournemirensis]
MKKIIYAFFTVLLIVSAGCKKDFFDINKNPNNPIEENMTPQLILPSVLAASAEKMATSYDYTAHWMGYWARSGTYGPSNPLENYDLTTSYERDEWVNGNTSVANPTVSWYNILMDNNTMEKKAQETGQTFYLGIAKVIKSIGFMYLVDQYNNVPYSDAFKGTESINPKYDKGQDIYNDLIAGLNEAKALFAAADEAANPGLAEADIVFGYVNDGKKTPSSFAYKKLMWRKLANTQHLKLLLRQSEISGNPTAEIAKIVADGSGFLMAGESANVDPGYSVNANQQNPFYDTYKRDYTGAVIDNFNRANNYILNKFRGNDDIRYQYIFSKAQTPIGGNEYFGFDFGKVDPNPDQPKAANSSDVAGPGLATSPTRAQWFFTSVESMFLQAEAIQRGWIAGTAQTAYENAVQESFSWLGAGSASSVLSGYAAWPATNPLATIITQKYMALCGINNFEAWVDYRRLGYPNDVPLSLSPSRGTRGIPVRLLYPQEEYSYNAANVGAEGTINAQTSKVFWDK